LRIQILIASLSLHVRSTRHTHTHTQRTHVPHTTHTQRTHTRSYVFYIYISKVHAHAFLRILYIYIKGSHGTIRGGPSLSPTKKRSSKLSRRASPTKGLSPTKSSSKLSRPVNLAGTKGFSKSKVTRDAQIQVAKNVRLEFQNQELTRTIDKQVATISENRRTSLDSESVLTRTYSLRVCVCVCMLTI
jgi:hypothetical protein